MHSKDEKDMFMILFDNHMATEATVRLPGTALHLSYNVTQVCCLPKDLMRLSDALSDNGIHTQAEAAYSPQLPRVCACFVL